MPAELIHEGQVKEVGCFLHVRHQCRDWIASLSRDFFFLLVLLNSCVIEYYWDAYGQFVQWYAIRFSTKERTQNNKSILTFPYPCWKYACFRQLEVNTSIQIETCVTRSHWGQLQLIHFFFVKTSEVQSYNPLSNKTTAHLHCELSCLSQRQMNPPMCFCCSEKNASGQSDKPYSIFSPTKKKKHRKKCLPTSFTLQCEYSTKLVFVRTVVI